MNVLRKIALALLTKAKYGRLSKRKMMFKKIKKIKFIQAY